MNQPAVENRWRKLALSHLPLAGALLILLYITLLDTPVLDRFRTEQTFGWMLVLWIPLAVVLGLTQLFIWIRWSVRTSSPNSRRAVKTGFLIALGILLYFATLRYLS